SSRLPTLTRLHVVFVRLNLAGSRRQAVWSVFAFRVSRFALVCGRSSVVANGIPLPGVERCSLWARALAALEAHGGDLLGDEAEEEDEEAAHYQQNRAVGDTVDAEEENVCQPINDTEYEEDQIGRAHV